MALGAPGGSSDPDDACRPWFHVASRRCDRIHARGTQVAEGDGHDGEQDHFDDILGAANASTRTWMMRKALLADGTRPGLPLLSLARLQNLLAVQRARPWTAWQERAETGGTSSISDWGVSFAAPRCMGSPGISVAPPPRLADSTPSIARSWRSKPPLPPSQSTWPNARSRTRSGWARCTPPKGLRGVRRQTWFGNILSWWSRRFESVRFSVGRWQRIGPATPTATPYYKSMSNHES